MQLEQEPESDPGKEEMPVYRYVTEGASGGNGSSVPPPRTLQKASPNSLSEEGKAGVLSIGPGPYWGTPPPFQARPALGPSRFFQLWRPHSSKAEDVCGAGLRGMLSTRSKLTGTV